MGIKVENLAVHYPSSTGPAIEDVSLTVEPGECIALTGPNGGGKTTILRAISGLIPRIIKAEIKGHVQVDGLDPAKDDISHKLQVLQQDPKTQVIGPTVLLEAALTPIFHGATRKEALERAFHALKRMRIQSLAFRSTTNLSGGELEKTAIAGVISQAPKYLLLDEPTSSLDSAGVEAVLELIERRGDTAMIIATHNPEIAKRCTRQYIVNKRLQPGIYTYQPQPPQPPRGSQQLVVELREIEHSYPGTGKILKNITLTIEKGTITAITGPNGSGKTTLLHIIAGLIKPSKGIIRLNEQPALLPQDPLLVFSKPTLRQEIHKDPPPWATHLLDTPILRLSWGNLRLASLALVASSGRRLLLLDEPTSGLDPRNRELVTKILAELAEKGYTIITATHDPLVARASNKAYHLNRGVLRECSSGC